jgi:HK97 family phage major capsid protein
MAKTATQLRQERADLIARARSINDQYADKETGLLPAENQQAFDVCMKDAEALGDQANRLTNLERAESVVENIISAPRFDAAPGQRKAETVRVRMPGVDAHGKPIYGEVPVGKRGSQEYRAAFGNFLRGGKLSSEQFAALRSDDDDQAGYLLATEQLTAGILATVDDLCWMRQVATIHTVPEAESLGIRKRTAKANTFDWSSELTLATEDSTLAFGKKVLTPRHLSGQIKVSRDLIRRGSVGVEQIVTAELARDAAETMEEAYLTGDGFNKPLGIFTASADGIPTGRDVLSGSATNLTADGLIEAKYALKSQYRNGGMRSGARWLFHRDGIRRAAQLKDNYNDYLLRPGRGLVGDDPDTMLGFPVMESEKVPNTWTAGLYVGMLANFRYYEIADALSMEMQVLTELYAATNQYGYIGRLKTDGLPTLDEAFVRIRTT